MSQVAADFQTQASSAVVAKASRQSSASQKTQSSRFDDLLSSIPDAPPPEPRARPKADAPERPQPAQAGSDKRAERTDRTNRTGRNDRPPRTDRTAEADTATVRGNASADEATPAKDASVAESETAATETKSDDGAAAGETKSADSDSKAAVDGETTDTTAVTQEAVAALVPQAVAAAPVPAAPVAEPTIDGEAAVNPDAAKVETPKAATQPSNDTAKQQAALPTDQSGDLNADDAEVLSVLAAKAQQGLKNTDGDKPEKKAASDKPVHTAKLHGESAVSGQPAETDGTEAKSADAKSTEAKPVNSELAKLGTEHQRSQGDGNAKAPADAAPAVSNANGATVKAADNFAAHLMSPTGHAAPASSTSSAARTATAPSSSADKPVAMVNVAVEISAKITSGKNQFDIRLDPEELGRIHVKVNVDRDGNVTTHMVADRRDTLDLLRRDTQGLERALQDAGLKTSDNSLQFSLRDQTQQNQQNGHEGQASRQPAAEDEIATTLTTTVIARDYGRYSLRPSGVDIRV